MKRLSLIMAVLKKDLLDSLKSKTVIFAIIMPILLSLVFRVALNPQQMSGLKLGIHDRGTSNFTNFVKKTGFAAIQVIQVEDQEKGREMVREGNIQGLLILPADFDEAVKKGKTPGIILWMDDTNLGKAPALVIALEKMLYLYNGQKPPAVLIPRSVTVTAGVKAAFIPTWLLFTILGAYMIVASSILEERERKTLQAVLVTPAGIPEILAGKGLTGFILTTLGALIILMLNQGFTGNITAGILIILAGVTFFTMFGLLIGLLLPGQTSANTFGSILYMAFFLPVVMAGSSKIMDLIAHFLPSFYVINGVHKTMFLNEGIDKVIPHFAFLILGSLAVFLAGYFILRHREDL